MSQISEFLAEYRGYQFHIDDYVESTQVISEVRSSLALFKTSFGKHFATWENQKVDFEAFRHLIPAYKGLRSDLPHYQDQLPIIRKKDLRQNEDHFVNESFDKSRLWVRPTSGTTGKPISVYYTPIFSFSFLLVTNDKVAHVLQKDYHLDCDELVQCLHFVDQPYLHNRVWATPQSDNGLSLRHYVNLESAESLSSAAEAISSFKPRIISGQPRILHKLLSMGVNCDPAEDSVKLVVSSGGHLPEDWQKTLDEHWQAHTVNAYGLSECGILASECQCRSGLLLYETDAIFEVLNDAGELVDTGTGELVVSNFRNKAMPLLRYGTEDRVEVKHHECRCGFKGRSMKFLERMLLSN